MIHTKEKKVLKEVSEIEEVWIECDVCGYKAQVTPFVTEYGENGHAQSFHKIPYFGNYFSTFFSDCTSYELDVCEKCLHEKFGSFFRIVN